MGKKSIRERLKAHADIVMQQGLHTHIAAEIFYMKFLQGHITNASNGDASVLYARGP